MRLLTPCVLAVLLVAPAASQSVSERGADDRAVRDVVRQYVDAREARDPKAVAALFTSDADQLVSSGEWRAGRENVVSGSLASTERGGRRTIDVERVRFVSKDVAIADGRYSITGMGEGADRRMWSTFVMTKGPAGWRIAAIRNMLPAAPVPAAK
jgi:uncharacterized protein (TIGR02246 family)